MKKPAKKSARLVKLMDGRVQRLTAKQQAQLDRTGHLHIEGVDGVMLQSGKTLSEVEPALTIEGPDGAIDPATMPDDHPIKQMVNAMNGVNKQIDATAQRAQEQAIRGSMLNCLLHQQGIRYTSAEALVLDAKKLADFVISGATPVKLAAVATLREAKVSDESGENPNQLKCTGISDIKQLFNTDKPL